MPEAKTPLFALKSKKAGGRMPRPSDLQFESKRMQRAKTIAYSRCGGGRMADSIVE
jgi:hypothetical protein